jgi:hypothetical protein
MIEETDASDGLPKVGVGLGDEVVRDKQAAQQATGE